MDDIEWDHQYIFNKDKQAIHPYLQSDYDITFNVQGLRALDDIIVKHGKRIFALAHSNSGKLTGEDIANLWGLGIKAAERTLKSITQVSTIYLNGKVHRRVHARMY